jgi:hypothetical protein
MRWLVLIVVSLATGCFDLSRLNGPTLDAAIRDVDASALVDAAQSICPADATSITMVNNLQPINAAFGGYTVGGPPGWGPEGGVSPGAPTTDGCITPGSAWYCAVPGGGNHYIEGPQVPVTVGHSYRMRAWIRSGAPADGGGFAEGSIYVSPASSAAMIAYQSFSDMTSGWQEVDTLPFVFSPDLGTPLVSPFFTLAGGACVVINYVSVEQTSP